MNPEEHPYCYPGTDVLRNKEDIRDKDELEAFERAHSADRLETLPHDLPITVAGYREIHRYMLQDVYDWAGEYRTVNTGRTAPFCRTEYIAAEIDKRFAAINSENDLHDLGSQQLAARAAEHVNELNAIHPFLDGNGRVQRAFLQVLAEQAGHEIDLARIDPQAWNYASIRGFYQQDHSAMCAILADAIVPAREKAADLAAPLEGEADYDRQQIGVMPDQQGDLSHGDRPGTTPPHEGSRSYDEHGGYDDCERG